MGSTRLPGKVLMDLAGSPMLAQQLRRLKRCETVSDIVVATTTGPEDEVVVRTADVEGVRWFRGSINDVLSRYLGAARDASADIIVRSTADCPLIDPEQTDRVVQELLDHPSECDYASNIIERTFPRGLDAEAMFRDTLERLDRLALSPQAREHVTTFLRDEQPELFRRRSVTDSEDNSDLRWTVDTPEDLATARRIYDSLDLSNRHVPYRQVLAHVRAQPQLVHGNQPNSL